MLYETARLRLESVDRVATLWLDSPDRGSNVLSRSLLRDLEQAFNAAADHPCLDVLVIRSTKPGSFLTGPSAAEYDDLAKEAGRCGFAAAGTRVFEQLRQLSKRTRTVAYIDGACRNAGLELALACDYRLAVATPDTQIGCDFLACGQLPCHGLTVRLPRLIGLGNGLDLMLNNRVLPAPRCARSRAGRSCLRRTARQDRIVVVHRGIAEASSPVAARSSQFLVAPAARTSLAISTDHHASVCPISQRPGTRSAGSRRVRLRGRAADGFAAEAAAFMRTGHHPDAIALRQQCGEREEFVVEWADVPVPVRVGVIGLAEQNATVVGMALRSGCSVVVQETDIWQRREGRKRLELAAAQAVAAGWLNIIEAEQKLQNVVVSGEESSLDSVELVFVTGSPEAQRQQIAWLDERLDSDVILVTTAGRHVHEVWRRPQRVASARILETSAVELARAP